MSYNLLYQKLCQLIIYMYLKLIYCKKPKLVLLNPVNGSFLWWYVNKGWKCNQASFCLEKTRCGSTFLTASPADWYYYFCLTLNRVEYVYFGVRPSAWSLSQLLEPESRKLPAPTPGGREHLVTIALAATNRRRLHLEYEKEAGRSFFSNIFGYLKWSKRQTGSLDLISMIQEGVFFSIGSFLKLERQMFIL